MADQRASPFRPTDDQARVLARGLLEGAKMGALGVHEADTGAPMVTRVGVGQDQSGRPAMLISDLSQHTKALRADAACSLLLGTLVEKGDPLNAPRLTLMGQVAFIGNGDAGYAALAARYLKTHPEAKLYIGFADFSFAVLTVERAYLNGGFGKAFLLTAGDLGL